MDEKLVKQDSERKRIAREKSKLYYYANRERILEYRKHKKEVEFAHKKEVQAMMLPGFFEEEDKKRKHEKMLKYQKDYYHGIVRLQKDLERLKEGTFFEQDTPRLSKQQKIYKLVRQEGDYTEYQIEYV
jgi:hypothetical protein